MSRLFAFLVFFTVSLEAVPNFVFIIADDLGWADVAFHGGNVPTPNLDRLLNEGVELTQHYVAPVCSPTRAGLMTGRCWSRFDVTTPQNGRALRWDTVTLPRALKSVGYETCITGKWHLGSKPEWGPDHFGFDHSYGSLAGGVGPYDHQYKKGAFQQTWHRNGKPLMESGHVTDLITKEACDWLSRRSEKPFLLYVPFTAVHLPVKEPVEWLAKVPAGITGSVARQYAACVMHLDDSVGQIVNTLERIGKRGETLVVFTSDNGGSTAENADMAYPADDYSSGRLPGSNKPLRDGKGSAYEGGTRVPCIASWPGKLKAGKHASPVQIIDWMPTFCALAGYKPERDLKWDGANLWPQLAEGAPPSARPIYTVGPGFRFRSFRVGDFKLVLHRKNDVETMELYNIAHDPSEEKDIAKLLPEKVAQLNVALSSYAKADRDARADD